MRRLGVLLANHRLVVWCLVLVLSIPPICGLTGFNLFEQSYARWVSEEQSKILQDIKKAFPNRFSGFPVILVVERDHFFQRGTHHGMHQTVKNVEEEFAGIDGDGLHGGGHRLGDDQRVANALAVRINGFRNNRCRTAG